MHTLYTLGYTGLKPEELLKAVEHYDATLVDVRISPYSRHPQWSGLNLSRQLGQQYIHIRALGNLNYKQPELGIKLVDPDEGCFRLVQLLKQRSVILLCACPDHHTCHRSTAAAEMEARYDVEVVHLSADDIRAIGKPPVEKQLTLF